MSRKSILLMIVVVLLFAGTGAAVAVLVRQEPEFYVKSTVPEGTDRKSKSVACMNQLLQLTGGIYDKQRDWSARFTNDQINSYLDEDFIKSMPQGLPEGVSQPRIAIQPDKIRLAFRYGKGAWSTIVSLDLRLWLTPKEPNVIALEFQQVHAGMLPISAQSLLERTTELAQQKDIDLTWYRHNGHPVALLRFQADKPNPTLRFQHLELYQGEIYIAGSSNEKETAKTVAALTKPIGN